MDEQIHNIGPNYKKIYSDVLEKKCPEKIIDCKKILEKKDLSTLDVLALNAKIFGINDPQSEKSNKKHISYNEAAILHILDYQKKNNINNTELAKHFKLSRNTLTKWKKLFT